MLDVEQRAAILALTAKGRGVRTVARLVADRMGFVLVDTGAMTLCLPAAVAEALQLEELERREVTLADGPAPRGDALQLSPGASLRAG